MAPLVALAGFMGSGKSSVGAALAHDLGWRFVDLDQEIVECLGMPIPRFFAEHGETAFRSRELEVLRRVLRDSQLAEDGVVVALGGGTLEIEEAARMLEQRGGVVLLAVDVGQAWERARGTGRPLARNRRTFATLFERRQATYRRVADWVFPVGNRSVAELGREVALAVRATGAAWPRSWGRQLVATTRRSTIIGGEGSLASVGPQAEAARNQGSRLFIITDRNVEEAWGDAVRKLAGVPSGEGQTLVLEPGEQSKSVRSLEECWEWLAAVGARRQDVVIALGGGVIGDLAGFAAATYQRGVRLWQVPTSLVAQVDSSVGGKTAVDLPSGKNLVGAFYQPDLVVIDPKTLTTLPSREFVSGLGEVVKYGLLSGEDLFGFLEEHRGLLRDRDPGVMSRVVRTCVAYKATVVEEDELDRGRRAVLNLGHTTAHALEVSLGYGQLSHGEAVALGLIVALSVSERLLGLDRNVGRRTRTLLADLGLPTSTPLPAGEVLETAAARDKKVTAASAGFVGLRSFGEPVWGLDLPPGLLVEALEEIRA